MTNFFQDIFLIPIENGKLTTSSSHQENQKKEVHLLKMSSSEFVPYIVKPRIKIKHNKFKRNLK